ncbi:Alpha-L-fucosidase [Lacunisphaera limnophila]|uniref:alpha-L-fucosidase n=1 Tax=Lacunisphaera limnophila TaxID=1838286 RepID=A0A1D8AUN5_9BACT|nr:alpha-L-fucosidase [Lacunisphaera limnophila]AOS44588.1 Alpha-L-fucosidase [Lacunisphaera limnophila]
MPACRALFRLLSLVSLLPATAVSLPGAPGPQRTFEPTWSSLHAYEAPAWFRDAKFGIFMHWGVQSLPAAANDGWYARHLYLQEGAPWGNAYAHHLKTYGHPSQFGFKDMIPLWKAERWDPDALVKFYKEIGARYIVPVAVHHDNFDLYDSKFQPWNSVNLGPKRDILRGWKDAADRHGLRFGASSHSDRSWDWFHVAHGADTHGPLKGVPYDGNLTKADGTGRWWEGLDPADLYGPPHAGGFTNPPHPDDAKPDQAYKDKWFARTQQLIDDYQPDLLYFDSPMPLGEHGLRLAASLYNRTAAPVLTIKSWGPGTVPDEGAVVLDIEKGQSDRLRYFAWQTDTSLNNNWFIDEKPMELTDEVVVHNLVDIVSKNGNLLLNVALRADGTLPDDQRAALTSVGTWLAQNGEAIYGTRPWKLFGEGPTIVAGGHFQQQTQPFTSADIRFTTKGDTLYAILLGWPADQRVRLKSLTAARRITLLGSSAALTWENSTEGVTVRLPAEAPGRFAYVLRIEGPESLFASTNLLAWCIVPYDSQKRTPAERIAMLQRLGFTQYVWDWRPEHLKDLPEEIKRSRAAGVNLRAIWLWIDGTQDQVGALGASNRAVFDAVAQAHLPVEFWVGFHDNYFAGLDDEARLLKARAMVAHLRDRAAETGGTVALYNHGGWFGEPENQLKILAAVGDDSVGLVYNFHHAHDQLDRYADILHRLVPHLRAVNLNGMRPEGPKILPLGQGTREGEMLRQLQAAGYVGPLGILGHVEDVDVEGVLRANLDGLRTLTKQP